jgi:hypothetical protein
VDFLARHRHLRHLRHLRQRLLLVGEGSLQA